MGSLHLARKICSGSFDYINNQKEHHKRGTSFEDEFVDLLKLHEIEFDLRYLWA